MASSKNSCFNCNEFTSDPLMNGWKCFTGEHAQLCYYCHSIYKSEEFCETFHSDKDGWKECEACNKLIHCGCLASPNIRCISFLGSHVTTAQMPI
nr:B3 domain-containing protein [Tanacetum cinerariifolium]